MGTGKQKLTSYKSIHFSLLLPTAQMHRAHLSIQGRPQHAAPCCALHKSVSTNPPHLSYASAQLGCACFLKHASASSTSVSSLRLLPGMPSSSIAICQNPTSSHGSFQAVRPLKPFPWKPDCACSSPPRRPMALGLCCSGTWIMPHVAGLSEFVCSSPSL